MSIFKKWTTPLKDGNKIRLVKKEGVHNNWPEDIVVVIDSITVEGQRVSEISCAELSQVPWALGAGEKYYDYTTRTACPTGE